MTGPIARLLGIPALILVAIGLCACGQEESSAASRCQYAKGSPLPDDIRQPEAVILRRAKRILRRAATTDRRSGLATVLAGSRYRIEAIGTWGLRDGPGHGRPDRVIGAIVDLTLDRPHHVDAIVRAAGAGWPRGSPNYRYSQRYGYVDLRVHLVARRLTGLSVLIDVRRGVVAEVGQGPEAEVEKSDTLPGQCPSRPPPPGYD